MTGAVTSDSLPNDSETFDVPDPEEPDSEVVAQLLEAGLSDAGIDAIAGPGTARRLHRERVRVSSRALAEARRARFVQTALLTLIVAGLVVLIIHRVFGPSMTASAAIAVLLLLIWAGLSVLANREPTSRTPDASPPKNTPNDRPR